MARIQTPDFTSPVDYASPLVAREEVTLRSVPIPRGGRAAGRARVKKPATL